MEQLSDLETYSQYSRFSGIVTYCNIYHTSWNKFQDTTYGSRCGWHGNNCSVEIFVHVCTHYALNQSVVCLFSDFAVFQFVIRVLNHGGEGLYNLFFHNCPNYGPSKVHASMTVGAPENVP